MESDRYAFVADVMNLMLDAVCVVDRDGRFLFVSTAFEHLFGYAPAEVVGKSMLDLVFPEDRHKTLCTVDLILAGALKPRFENRWIHKSGRIVDVMWSARWSEEHQVRIAVARDITEQKRLQVQLQRMAQHDPLTDLPNRALFQDRLHTAFTHARRDNTQLCLLFIDLDGFKQINDNFGHLVGDRLLQKVAARLRDCVRESDTVARMGGDEFVVLTHDVHAADDGVQIAEKIRAAIAQPYAIGDLQVGIAPSIGIALYPQHGDDYQQLLRSADNAMYRAKNAGGDCSMLFELLEQSAAMLRPPS